ncbi:MAG: organic hydroperoxide reductase OsmC/OhrA [Candidatus Azotimanducaceae bacterium]|jgi:organic hydroperoxide reductase OsmC/OhrA
MQDLPHHYTVVAQAGPEGEVDLVADKVEVLHSAPPPEFGGPGNRWSPESLLVAAVADCFVLSFKGIARASKLTWVALNCEVEGTLARVERTTKFTDFKVNAALTVAKDSDEKTAHRLLQKAEASCLITNSLSATTHLAASVLVES